MRKTDKIQVIGVLSVLYFLRVFSAQTVKMAKNIDVWRKIPYNNKLINQRKKDRREFEIQ